VPARDYYAALRSGDLISYKGKLTMEGDDVVTSLPARLTDSM